jgi:hypothetical protein
MSHNDQPIQEFFKEVTAIAGDCELSQSEQKSKIKALIKNINDTFKTKPTVLIFPYGHDYIIFHVVLKNEDHVLYIHQGDKSQAIIIHSLKEHEEVQNKGKELMQKINTKTSTLTNTMKTKADELKTNATKLPVTSSAASSSAAGTTGAGYLELATPYKLDALEKVTNLLVDTPNKLSKYIEHLGGATTLQSTDLLNKIYHYLQFGDGMIINPKMTIPFDGDVIHKVTDSIVSSLKI